MKTGLYLLIAATLLAGCADQVNSLNSTLTSAVTSLQGHANASPTTDAFATSGLPGIFRGKPASSGWPRVALTIDSMPADANAPRVAWTNSGGGYSPPPNWCMTVSAVVWTSPRQSREIHNVPFCGWDIPQGQPGSTVTNSLYWSTMPKSSVKNTGAARTTGPNPPLKSFPNHGFFVENAASKAAFMFDHLLMSMGLDLADDPSHEYRLWVVSTVQ